MNDGETIEEPKAEVTMSCLYRVQTKPSFKATKKGPRRAKKTEQRRESVRTSMPAAEMEGIYQDKDGFVQSVEEARKSSKRQVLNDRNVEKNIGRWKLENAAAHSYVLANQQPIAHKSYVGSSMERPWPKGNEGDALRKSDVHDNSQEYWSRMFKVPAECLANFPVKTIRVKPVPRRQSKYNKEPIPRFCGRILTQEGEWVSMVCFWDDITHTHETIVDVNKKMMNKAVNLWEKREKEIYGLGSMGIDDQVAKTSDDTDFYTQGLTAYDDGEWSHCVFRYTGKVPDIPAKRPCEGVLVGGLMQ